MFLSYKWMSSKAHIVNVNIKARIKDSGTSNSNINITVNGSPVITSNSNAGLNVKNTWTSTTNDLTNNIVNFNDNIEVTVDNVSTNKDARDLSIILILVNE